MGLLHASKAHDTSCVQHIPLKKKVVFNISFQKKKQKKKKLCSTNWRETREIHFSLDSGMNSGLRYNL